jgi:hypothetical protein
LSTQTDVFARSRSTNFWIFPGCSISATVSPRLTPQPASAPTAAFESLPPAVPPFAIDDGEAIRVIERPNEKFEFPVKWGVDLQSEH